MSGEGTEPDPAEILRRAMRAALTAAWQQVNATPGAVRIVSGSGTALHVAEAAASLELRPLIGDPAFRATVASAFAREAGAAAARGLVRKAQHRSRQGRRA